MTKFDRTLNVLSIHPTCRHQLLRLVSTHLKQRMKTIGPKNECFLMTKLDRTLNVGVPGSVISIHMNWFTDIHVLVLCSFTVKHGIPAIVLLCINCVCVVTFLDTVRGFYIR